MVAFQMSRRPGSAPDLTYEELDVGQPSAKPMNAELSRSR